MMIYIGIAMIIHNIKIENFYFLLRLMKNIISITGHANIIVNKEKIKYILFSLKRDMTLFFIIAGDSA